jgi:hypothetical protein
MLVEKPASAHYPEGKTPIAPASPEGVSKLYQEIGQCGYEVAECFRLECLHRHTFAVRVLESTLEQECAVGWRVRALSTYLGHSRLSDTSTYLHATPKLMQSVADSCRRFLEGGGQ